MPKNTSTVAAEMKNVVDRKAAGYDRSGKAATRRVRSKKYQRYPLTHLLLALGAFIMAAPFLWQLIMSVSTNAEIQSIPPTFIPESIRWDNYTEVFHTIPFLNQIGTSVLITVIRTGAQIILCSMAGYAFARMEFPGRDILFAALLLILMIPNQVYMITQYQLIQSFNLLETPWGIVLPGLFSALGTFLMRQAFVAMPKELEEAARIDGANQWEIFWKIMFPLAKPSLFAVGITTTLWSWNDLLWPLVVTTQDENMPISVGITAFSGQYSSQYNLMMAASVMAMAPIFLLFFTLQKRVIDGLAYSGVKG